MFGIRRKKNLEREDYKFSLTQDNLQYLITDDKLIDYVSEKADKELNETLKVFKSLQEKGLKIIIFVLTVNSIILGYLFSSFKFDILIENQISQIKYLFIMGIVTVIYLTIIGVHVTIKCYMPKKLKVPGNKPKNLLNDNILASKRFNVIRLSQLEQTQLCIQENVIVVNDMGYEIKQAMIGVLLFPIITSLSYLCYYWLV